MYQKMLTNASSMYKKLNKSASDSTTLYSDGFEINNMVSMRLSNVPKNLTHAWASSLKMFILLAHYAKASEYFSAPSGENNYRFDGEGINVSPGECGTIAQHAVAYPYEPATELWQSSPGQATPYSAQLFRGAGEALNSTIENCISLLIQNQTSVIDAANAIAKAAADAAAQATYDAEMKKFNVIIISLFGSVLGAAVIFFMIHLFFNNSNCHQNNDLERGTNDQNVPTSNNKSFSTDDDSSDTPDSQADESNTKDAPDSITYQTRNQFFQHTSSAEKVKALSFEARLAAITLDDPIPSHFICPITQSIMTYPAMTDDGHNYEKAALKILQKNKKPCPLNQDLQVINIIPNHDLRSEIFTYVEAQEENFAKKQKLAI